MITLRNILPFFAALLFVSCQGSTAEADAPPPTIKVPEAEFTDPATVPDPAVPQKDDLLYTWVDGLNVRSRPSTSADRVARVTPAEPLTFTGQVSERAETIVLRGAAYHEPWYRITTADKKDGWVFGGAVKLKQQRKGSKALKGKEIDFPVFGYYDLNKWSTDGAEEREVGDRTTNVITYTKDNQVLEITQTSVGEYGYDDHYKLTDREGNLLKERTFVFSIDPLLLTETVIDNLSIPAIKYVRTQTLDKHYVMLNERPRVALGEWVSEAEE